MGSSTPLAASSSSLAASSTMAVVSVLLAVVVEMMAPIFLVVQLTTSTIIAGQRLLLGEGNKD